MGRDTEKLIRTANVWKCLARNTLGFQMQWVPVWHMFLLLIQVILSGYVENIGKCEEKNKCLYILLRVTTLVLLLFLQVIFSMHVCCPDM